MIAAQGLEKDVLQFLLPASIVRKHIGLASNGLPVAFEHSGRHNGQTKVGPPFACEHSGLAQWTDSLYCLTAVPMVAGQSVKRPTGQCSTVDVDSPPGRHTCWQGRAGGRPCWGALASDPC